MAVQGYELRVPITEAGGRGIGLGACFGRAFTKATPRGMGHSVVAECLTYRYRDAGRGSRGRGNYGPQLAASDDQWAIRNGHGKPG